MSRISGAAADEDAVVVVVDDGFVVVTGSAQSPFAPTLVLASVDNGSCVPSVTCGAST